MSDTLTRQKIVKKDEQQNLRLTGDALISFISGTQTNIGRSTFYNMKKEQRDAMINMHLPVMSQTRPFYTLMMLPTGVNDVNKQMIAWNLIEKSAIATDEYIDEAGLRHKYSKQTMWENELILQVLDNMSIPRVFDFFTMMQEKRIIKKRAMFLIREFLRRNKKKWPLWALKYRIDFRRALRHSHIKFNHNAKHSDSDLTKIWRYLKYNEVDGCPQMIQDYAAVQSGDQSKLGKLPSTVAEGFMTQFNLNKEEFWKIFDSGGGKFTTKEKRTKATSVAKAGVDTGFDINKTGLYDALVYLHSLDRLPESVRSIRNKIDVKAKSIANKLSFTLDNVGLILDTSISMYGTKEGKYHPMLKSLAISAVLKQASNGFKEYRTNASDELFPVLQGQSNYTDAFLQAIKDGCKTIIIVGDGYENAPFENAFHQVLYTFKNKIDKKNHVMVLQFNPVFAAESFDARAVSSLVPSIGIGDIKALNEVMFLAIAKHKPLLAVAKYFAQLTKLQSPKAKKLMPTAVKRMISTKKVKFINQS